MTLADIRDYIATLEIAESAHCYMGRLDNKKEKSLGVYKLKRSGAAKIPIGGMSNAVYGTYPVSMLIHWNKSPRDTETAAVRLYEALRDAQNVSAGDEVIKFCNLLMPEPVDVGTDDSGICEMVIEVIFYFERKKG